PPRAWCAIFTHLHDENAVAGGTLEALVIAPSPLVGEGSRSVSTERNGRGVGVCSEHRPLTRQNMLNLRRCPLPQGERAQSRPPNSRCHRSPRHPYDSDCFTRSGENGTRRMRTPVASKIALAIAAATGRMLGSPAPDGSISGWLISTKSICSGVSVMSRIG